MHRFRTAEDTQSLISHYDFSWAHKILIERLVHFRIVNVVNMPYHPNFNTLYYVTLSLFSNQKVGWKYVIEGSQIILTVPVQNISLNLMVKPQHRRDIFLMTYPKIIVQHILSSVVSLWYFLHIPHSLFFLGVIHHLRLTMVDVPTKNSGLEQIL